ncbi:Csu type fimbrial protein [Pseudomonas tohonis]|uniref:Csu type fimbrial protein n=1 Tax=Pseudomonas tohonis TaxID=2725477 RepID=UPI0021D9D6BE|nr:spore coat U domain-containing protein [Pseudomonas tohonis]UXY53873.1 spore coat U domain-containing protein [Pseudomonas tohonis]
MNRAQFLLSSLVLLPLSSSLEAAGTVQGQLGIQLVIGAGCTVNNGSNNGSANTFGSISFGTYPSLNSIIEAQSVGSSAGSSFGVTCNTGTNYSVALDSGLHATGNQRNMSAGATDVIAYNLYKEAARTTLWGNGSNGGTALAGTGTGANQELVVYGRVPPQTTPATGTYTDTVQVTITW